MKRSISFSQAEIDEIREMAAHYPDKSAASIETLKLVQKYHRWVSDEALVAAADLLDMSPAELDGVATFYNLIYRRPVGRQVVHCCNSVSCWMLGAEETLETISAKLGIGLGETTADGEYTLLPIVCLGACDKAPVLMINDQTYFNVDRDRLNELLESREEI
ncbi:MAG: NADH-quinone oxidoreductase subunit NuoE [Methylococcaceae bacterium]|nr:NADH-quinone oxidoreductase subunit NuoE [Methylococcaceae bacterium]